ncbi:hypothetical protein BJ138DRAFT_1238989 [Hygrophoropsis aurantiaca]|uniref:Uncharacterized protein n=1 Tax=Hygrophoropsis aurantiaca TaxID=72124 RepID=A0ACB8AF70_9AGAM|nr:hypothetical protein BJ138DRAFT_1238989 [Hygrophoropsis aurantiaca]
MRGFQYDMRAMASMELHSSLGINTRDHEATHVRRAARAVSRKVLVQHRVLAGIKPDADNPATESRPLATHTEPHHSAAESPAKHVSWTENDVDTSQLSLHPHPDSLPISKFSTLTHALTPGAGIVEYWPKGWEHISLIRNSTTNTVHDLPNVPITRFSTLDGALDETRVGAHSPMVHQRHLFHKVHSAGPLVPLVSIDLSTNGHDFAYIPISRFSTLDGALDETRTYSPIARYHSPYEISGTVSPSSHRLPSSITDTAKLRHYTTPPNALPHTARMFDLQTSLYRISEEKTSDWLTGNPQSTPFNISTLLPRSTFSTLAGALDMR